MRKILVTYFNSNHSSVAVIFWGFVFANQVVTKRFIFSPLKSLLRRISIHIFQNNLVSPTHHETSILSSIKPNRSSRGLFKFQRQLQNSHFSAVSRFFTLCSEEIHVSGIYYHWKRAQTQVSNFLKASTEYYHRQYYYSRLQIDRKARTNVYCDYSRTKALRFLRNKGTTLGTFLSAGKKSSRAYFRCIDKLLFFGKMKKNTLASLANICNAINASRSVSTVIKRTKDFFLCLRAFGVVGIIIHRQKQYKRWWRKR